MVCLAFTQLKYLFYRSNSRASTPISLSPTGNTSPLQYNSAALWSPAKSTPELPQVAKTTIPIRADVTKSRKQPGTIRSPIKSSQVSTTSSTSTQTRDVRKPRKPEDFFEEFLS